MFSKVWRVHRFATKSKTDPKVFEKWRKRWKWQKWRKWQNDKNDENDENYKNDENDENYKTSYEYDKNSYLFFFLQKKVEPWKLYTMVSGLVAVDLIILLTWQFQDPLQRRLEQFPLEDPISSNDDVKIRPELEHCESTNNSVWLGE